MSRWILLLIVFLSGVLAHAAPPTPDELALRILDSEAVYTVGGLKPISDGFWQTRFPAELDTTDEIESVRRTLSSLPLGPNCVSGVFLFSQPFDGKRSASAFIAHLPSLRALVIRRRDVFEPIGISSETPTQQVMERIDRAEQSVRWRAFGLVFGYPEYAVEFFVDAGKSEKKTGKFVERGFLAIPTVASETGRFVYAIPKGHVEREEDRQLKMAAAPIFEQYLARRSLFIREGGAGAVALMQDWTSSMSLSHSVRIPQTCILRVGRRPHIVFRRHQIKTW